MNVTEYKRALARVYDNADGIVLLYRKGVNVGAIKPSANDYETKKEVIDNYSYYLEENYEWVGNKRKRYFLLWVNDLAITFDDFKEEWA